MTESTRRSGYRPGINYLASLVFGGGLKWIANWRRGVKNVLPLMSRN
jgi:hypothetical protein